jgi:hypothetical protein
MATNIMRNTDFRSIVEPILNEEFDGVYDQRKDEYMQIFKVKTGIPRDRHEEPVLFGFGAAPELPEGMPVTYQAGGVLFLKEYFYKRYGLAFALTSTLIEDGDHIRIGSVYSQHLAQSLIETKETLTANVNNNAFSSSYPGGDGVSLSNSAHPIATGTFSNILATAAALSQTSAEQMLITVRTNGVDNNNKKIHLEPSSLVVAPANEFQGEVIVKSVLRSGTANNDLNAIKSRGYLSKGVAVITRLTSATAWWVHNSNVPFGLQVVMRAPLKKTMEGDFETDSWRYKAIERYDVGFTDPRTEYGTPGM